MGFPSCDGSPDPQGSAFRNRFSSYQLVRESGCISEPAGSVSLSINFMSQHPSLKGKGSIQAKRSVLKRFERVDLLKKRGQFKDGQRVLGLPKTKPED